MSGKTIIVNRPKSETVTKDMYDELVSKLETLTNMYQKSEKYNRKMVEKLTAKIEKLTADNASMGERLTQLERQPTPTKGNQPIVKKHKHDPNALKATGKSNAWGSIPNGAIIWTAGGLYNNIVNHQKHGRGRTDSQWETYGCDDDIPYYSVGTLNDGVLLDTFGVTHKAPSGFASGHAKRRFGVDRSLNGKQVSYLCFRHNDEYHKPTLKDVIDGDYLEKNGIELADMEFDDINDFKSVEFCDTYGLPKYHHKCDDEGKPIQSAAASGAGSAKSSSDSDETDAENDDKSDDESIDEDYLAELALAKIKNAKPLRPIKKGGDAECVSDDE
jgi:hypothetical protein